MSPLGLDFLGNRTTPGAVSWLLLAIGVALFGPALDRYLADRDNLAGLEARVARLRQRTAGPEGPSRPAKAATRDDAGLRLALELATPWDAVFEAVELAVDGRVTLLALAGEGKGRALRLEAEARSMSDALDFTQRLRDSLRFDSVDLVSHEARPAGGVNAVRFQLRAVWSPP